MIKKIITRIKLYISYLLSKNDERYSKFKSENKNIVVALAADYGNLGDVAITYAQTKYLKEKFPNANIIDFPISDTFTGLKSLQDVIKTDDIITIVGGGNMGDLYDDIEFCRQFIIRKFPNNDIISFPQTIDFSNSLGGILFSLHSKRIYSKHKNLYLFAREKKSFEKFKKLFSKNKNIFLSPDIVMYLNEENLNIVRKDCTLIFRNDEEKVVEEDIKDDIINKLSKYYNYSKSDTHIEKDRLSLIERENELKTIWSIFQKSELVITDRLHGMIFSFITNTPCIAFDNSNNKVSGVKNLWLSSVDNIIMYNEDYSIEDTIESLTKIKYPKKQICFSELDNIIKSIT